MIQANELRIGNLVLFKGNKIKVEPVEISYCEQYQEEFNETFKPIELTEEILLKCGFVKKGNLTYIFEDFKIEFKNGLFLFFTFHYCVKLKSLHQLQNLYWCLTNKELNVQL